MPLSDSTSVNSMNVSATLFLACPEIELSGPSPFKQLLINFSPRPHLVVMSGPCLPLGPGSIVKESDIVVVTCETPQAIEGEVQYLTELWSLRGDLKKMFSSGMVTIHSTQIRCGVYMRNLQVSMRNRHLSDQSDHCICYNYDVIHLESITICCLYIIIINYY